MHLPKRLYFVGLIMLTLVLGCAAPASRPSSETAGGSSAPSAGPKHMTIAFKEDVPALSDKVRMGPGAGVGLVEDMVNAGLVIIDGNGTVQAQNAEQVPSIENGLWKLNADGTMETRLKLRPGITWHDGTPFTSADLLFTATIERDTQVAINRSIGWGAVESVDAADAQTIVVQWKRHYIEADQMFSRRFAMPVASHKLEAAYNENAALLPQHAYWTSDFVGTGAYVVRDFVLGSHLALAANDRYTLGRPKVDEIEIRFINDANTLLANVLSGQIDAYFGPGLTIEQGVEIRNQWTAGRMEQAPANWLAIHPQMLNPTPAIVTNLEFRRALLHALDRQQMVDTLQAGLTSVAHSFLHPNQPQYREIESQLPHYDYDPRRAEQMVADLGYTKAADGFLRDAAGQRLSVETRTTNQIDIQPSGLLTVADYWQRIGVQVDQVLIPVQRQRDAEYRSTFPAFELLNGPPSGEEGIAGLHSARTRLPQNSFTGSNYPRYMNPDFDALIDRYFVTIPKGERTEVLGGIIRHIAENLNEMGLIHIARPVLIANRLSGAGTITSPQSTEAWNSAVWEVR